MQPLSSYTLADPKVMQNPYPYYERLRAEDPVHFDQGIRTWLVARHEDIVAAAGNTEVFSDEMRVSASIRSPFQAEVNEYMQREGFLLLDAGVIHNGETPSEIVNEAGLRHESFRYGNYFCRSEVIGKG